MAPQHQQEGIAPDPRQARLAALAEQVAALAEQVAAVGAALPGGTDRASADAAAEARSICLRLLTAAPRPRAGLAQALARRNIPVEVAEGVLDRLTDVGLIDDAAYAQSFVRVKHRDRALGQVALRNELRKKGLDEHLVNSAVLTVDADAERNRATELVDKRVDAAMAAGPVAARRRLLGLLSRRGYGPEVSLAVVDAALDAYGEGPSGQF